MDEADCFGPQRDYVGGNRSLALPVPVQDESFMYERVKNEKASLNNCINNFESSFPGEIDTKPFENALSASFPSLTSTTATKAQEKTLSPTPKDEGYCESPSIHGDGSCQHHIDYEKSRRETQCGDLSSTKEFDSQINLSNTARSSSDCSIMRYHRDELPSSIGTDETDQGRVVPNFSLAEHPTALSNSQYYPKPIDSAGLKFVSDPKLKESPGLSCQPTAISHNHRGHYEESPSAIHHQCTSASSTLQGGVASNIKPFGSSNKPVEGEVSKRKASCDEQIEEDQTLRMKRQKMSTNIQQGINMQFDFRFVCLCKAYTMFACRSPLVQNEMFLLLGQNIMPKKLTGLILNNLGLTFSSCAVSRAFYCAWLFTFLAKTWGSYM